jgi:hypothetical protein
MPMDSIELQQLNVVNIRFIIGRRMIPARTKKRKSEIPPRGGGIYVYTYPRPILCERADKSA